MYPNRFRAQNTFDATSPLPGPRSGLINRSINNPTIQQIRERILQNVLNGSVILSLVALIATIPTRFQEKQYGLIAFFTLAFVCVVIVAVAKQIPYLYRSLAFLALLFSLGVSTLISDGLYGNGRVFLMALPVMTAILLGRQGGVIALGINLGAVAAIGVLILLNVITPPVFISNNINSSWALWIVAFVVAVLVSTVIVISLIVIFQGLQSTIESEQRVRSELNSERAALEGRVQDRTRDLERRLVQIRTASEISLALNAELDPQKVLQQVVDLVQKRFDLYYVGVFLIDDANTNAVLKAGSGEAGQRMLDHKHYLPLSGNSMIAWAIKNKKPRIALDVGKEAVRFNNPDLPLTRSEMALPIISQSVRVGLAHEQEASAVGALTVQSTHSTAFDQDDITLLVGIANSLATALQNATLFNQVQRNLEDIRILNRQYLQQAWSVEPGQTLQVVSEDPLITNQLSDRATLEVNFPLEVREQVIGNLNILLPSRNGDGTETQKSEPDALSREDHEFVNEIVTQTALALENIRLLEETQQKAAYEKLISSITVTARSATDLDTILRKTVHDLGNALNTKDAFIQLQLEPVGSQNSLMMKNESKPGVLNEE